ncbi:MAG TPA: I78 family peptidase inhibitor [Micavibrio sp.]
MDKRKFRLAVVTPVVTALVVVTVIVVLILQGAAGPATPEEGVTYSPDMAAVSEPSSAEMAEDSQPVDEASCNFNEWVGKEVDEDAVKAAGRPYRILPPDGAATMDFSPERINVMIDENRIVTAVRCG